MKNNSSLQSPKSSPHFHQRDVLVDPSRNLQEKHNFDLLSSETIRARLTQCQSDRPNGMTGCAREGVAALIPSADLCGVPRHRSLAKKDPKRQPL